MRPVTILAFALLAAGCSEKAAAPTQQGEAAAGEVLAGSISDAMVPLDQLQSQGPLAPRQAPAVNDIDGEQPEVSPVPGIEGAAPAEAAEAAPAAPAPDVAPAAPAPNVAPAG
jgi:hypothetical protein